MLNVNSTDLKRGRHCIWTVLLLFSPAIPCIVPSERVPSSNSTSSGLFLQHNPRQLKCSLLLPKIGGLRNSLCRKAGLHTPSSPSLRSQACVLKMGIPYMYFLANWLNEQAIPSMIELKVEARLFIFPSLADLHTDQELRWMWLNEQLIPVLQPWINSTGCSCFFGFCMVGVFILTWRGWGSTGKPFQPW